MITGRWGHPSYVALDVLLDDGSSELFWHHELEDIEGVTQSKRLKWWSLPIVLLRRR